MDGRERLRDILNRQPVDRLAWTTLVDDKTRSVMPPEIRAMSSLEFYRHVGCDILQFGNYGLAEELCVREARRIMPCQDQWSNADGLLVRTLQTPWGTLTASFRGGHPIKYPVETVDDLRVLSELWRQTRYEESPDAVESSRRLIQAIG